MTGPRDGVGLPDAGTKLRLVLDYLPCEACLAQPTEDQDLLCTLCARLDRQVAVRVETRTTILIERPSAPEAPIVIAPAPEAPPAPAPEPAAPREVSVRFAEDVDAAQPGTTEVVIEPLAPLPPLAALAPRVEEPAVAVTYVTPLPEPAPAPAPVEEIEFDIGDIISYTPARDEFFDYKRGPTPPKRAPQPPPEPVRAAEPVVEDDFVFRPPTEEASAQRAEPAEGPLDQVVPREEVVVEAAEEVERWAPSPDIFPDAEPSPLPEEPVERDLARESEEGVLELEAVPDDEILEMEPVAEEEEILELEPVAEEEAILEMEPVAEEEEILETEVLSEEEAVETEPAPPAPSGSGDLYRLRGFDAASESALAKVRITEVAHLAGHDAGELASRSGVPFDRILPWIQVADLVQEVGVPMDAATALVAAGIAGPRGLAEADPEEVADRVAAFGSYALNARDVRRWKRRA